MFFFNYLRRELTRRAGRTFLTVAGLAVGVTLVVAITAVSGGLDGVTGVGFSRARREHGAARHGVRAWRPWGEARRRTRRSART